MDPALSELADKIGRHIPATDWADVLIGFRHKWLLHAAAAFTPDAPEAETQADNIWKWLTEKTRRDELEKCCEQIADWRNADAARLHDNACLAFATGVAAGLVRSGGRDALEGSLVWLARAADCPEPLDLDAQLLKNAEEPAGDLKTVVQHLLDSLPDPTQPAPPSRSWKPTLWLWLNWWLNNRQVPGDPIERMTSVSFASVELDQPDIGHVHRLRFYRLPGLIPTGADLDVIDHPDEAFRPLAREWREVLKSQYHAEGSRTPVAWSMETLQGTEGPSFNQRRTLSGESHTLAARVGLHALAKNLDIDPGCLLAAKLDGLKLRGVGELKAKCDAAWRSERISTVVIASGSQYTGGGEYRQGKREMPVERRKYLGAALELATGLPRFLGHYLKSLQDLPDRNAPLYFKGRTFTEGPLYIEPLVTETAACGGCPSLSVMPKTRAFWPDGQEWPDKGFILLQGPVGSGKTVVSRMTAHRLAVRGLAELTKGERRTADITLPVWIPLMALVTNGSLDAAIEATVLTAWPPGTGTEELELVKRSFVPNVKARLTGEHCWLLLDGLDEVPTSSRTQVLQELKGLEDGKCQVVLTSRDLVSIEKCLPFIPNRVFHLCPWQSTQRDQFLQWWFRGKSPLIEQSIKGIGEISQNPLLLTLACAEAEVGRLPPRMTRAQLYAGIVHDLIRGAWQVRECVRLAPREFHYFPPLEREDPTCCHALLSLQRVAWDLFQQQPGHFEVACEEWFKRLGGDAFGHQAKALIKLYLQTGLLTYVPVQDKARGDQDRWAFTHRWVFEYLVASHIASLEEEGWCARVVTLLGRSPGAVLDLVELLGELLDDRKLKELAREVAAAVPQKWAGWSRVLQRLLSGCSLVQATGARETAATKAPLEKLLAATTAAAIHIHPEALLPYCHFALYRDESPDCRSFALELANAARGRLWCHPDHPLPARSGGEQSRRGPLHEGPVHQVASVGAHVLSLGRDGTVVAWNPGTGVIDDVVQAQSPVRVLTLQPNGLLFLGCDDGGVRYWSPAVSETKPRLLYRESSPVTAILCADTGSVVAGHENGLVVRCNLGSASRPVELGRHRGPVRHLAALPFGSLASGGEDGVVAGWSLTGDEKPLGRFPERYGPVRGLTWWARQRLLLSSHSTGVVAAWSGRGGPTPILRSEWPISSLVAVGDLALAGDWGGYLYRFVFGLSEARVTRVHRHETPVAGIAVSDAGLVVSVDETGRRRSILAEGPFTPAADGRLCWLPDGWLAFGAASGEVEAFAPERDNIARSGIPDRAVVTLLPGPERVVAAARDGTLLLQPESAGRHRIREPIGCLIRAGDFLVAGTDTGKLLLLTADGEPLRVMPASRGEITALVWWEDSGQVACGDATGSLRLVSLDDLRHSGNPKWKIHSLPACGDGRLDPVRCIEALPEDILVVSAAGVLARLRSGMGIEPIALPGRGRALFVKRRENGQAVVALASGALAILDVSQANPSAALIADAYQPALRVVECQAVSGGSARIVSGHADGTLRLLGWDGAQPGSPVKAHRGPVSCLALSAEVLASTGADGVLALRHWESPLDPAKFILPATATALTWLPDGRLAAGLNTGEIVVFRMRGACPKGDAGDSAVPPRTPSEATDDP
jgi:WD40 repeat protein